MIFSTFFVGLWASACSSAGIEKPITPQGEIVGLPSQQEVGWVTGTPLSQDQKAELADDIVTRGEYEAAYLRYVACVSEGGYEILQLGEAGGVHDYAIPDGAVVSGVNDTCYDKEFVFIEAFWRGMTFGETPTS